MSRLPEHPGLAVVREDAAGIARELGAAAQRFAGKTVLITGAAGMLPAHLTDALAHLNDARTLDQPMRLLLLVRRPPVAEGRLAHLVGREDVRFLVQDVTTSVEPGEDVHFIVHAASHAAPRAYRQDPVGTLAANSTALHGLLELGRRQGVESFLYFSSSEIYGPQPEQIPTPEEFIGRTEFAGGRACYIEAKRFGEAMTIAYHEQYRLPVKIVRPFHVHGPGLRLDDGRIVAALLEMGFEGRPFELLSDGKATRTYGYISDATLGFLQVLLSDCEGEAFNVGADEPETTILELATVVSRLFGRTEPVRTNPDAPPAHLAGAPLRVCPDLGKIRRRLGYQPRVGLEEGLERTMRWHALARARPLG